jgi:hypothetical protein
MVLAFSSLFDEACLHLAGDPFFFGSWFFLSGYICMYVGMDYTLVRNLKSPMLLDFTFFGELEEGCWSFACGSYSESYSYVIIITALL